ncbi:MAG: TIR domain-containing protein [Candidatus Lokiarchaeota archaeon]|nr:TIR domain-containing protein [Candidatus Lokiarchaeota archaeon]
MSPKEDQNKLKPSNIGTICESCGMPLIQDKYKSSLCNICTLNNQTEPIFESILFGVAYGYYMTKLGFKNSETALKKSYDGLCELPYWNSNTEKVPAFKELVRRFDSYIISFLIESKMANVMDSIFVEKKPDIFISHVWNAEYDTFIDLLVFSLKARGYTVWYDKDMGLKPGSLREYFKNNIANSDTCIPIICQKYFTRDNTQYELDEIFKLKEQQHIIPIWWADVDRDYIKKQKPHGEDLVECAGISWDIYKGQMNNLMNILIDYMDKIQGFETYNNVKLYKDEATTMRDIEQLIGLKIPEITSEYLKFLDICDEQTNNDEIRKHLPNFGFIHKNNHIIALIVRETEYGYIIPVFNLPNSIIRLQELKLLDVPIVRILEDIRNMKSLEFIFFNDGLIEEVPSSINDLPELRKFTIYGNPIKKIDVGFNQYCLNQAKEMDLYPNLVDEERAVLFLLQILTKHEIPEVKEVKDQTFGFIASECHVTEIGLYKRNLLTIPDTIKKFKRLEILLLRVNQISYLPRTLETLKFLKKINLESNQLKDLPENLGDISTLEELGLSVNQLSIIPTSIGKLKHLRKLDLSHNNIVTLPSTLGELKSLVFLFLQENFIQTLPESIVDIRPLEKLNIQKNRLRMLPKDIHRLISLEELTLYDNKLTSLPEFIGKLKDLRTLDVKNNLLFSLPKKIINITNLKELWLDFKKISPLQEHVFKWITDLKRNGCSIYL